MTDKEELEDYMFSLANEISNDLMSTLRVTLKLNHTNPEFNADYIVPLFQSALSSFIGKVVYSMLEVMKNDEEKLMLINEFKQIISGCLDLCRNLNTENDDVK